MPYSLVTGGAGFIGAHVVRSLLEEGKEVLVLDDLSGGFEENIPEKALFVKGSITDHELLEKLFNDYEIEYVYHLAAYAAEGLSHFIKRFNDACTVFRIIDELGPQAKRCARCAQIVRNRGQHSGAVFDKAFQACGHAVKRLGRTTNFNRPGFRHRFGIIAPPDPIGGAGQNIPGPRNAPRQEIGDHGNHKR